jgi:hypothetical protein
MSDTTTTVDPIALALEPYRDRLTPGSITQIQMIMRDDFPGMTAAVVADLVRARLAAPEYRKFFATDPTTTTTTTPPAAPAAEAAPVTDVERRQVDSLRASVGRGPLAGKGRTALG